MHLLSAVQSAQALLEHLPLWTTSLLLYFLTINILFIGRKVFENLEYNVSWSSQQGDAALIGCILIGASILQASPKVPASYLFSALGIGAAVLSGVGAFVLAVSGILPAELMDTYHNVIIVPIYIWLLGTVIPTIYVYGDNIQKSAGVSLFLVWVACLAFDLKTGRLNQRKYLQSRFPRFMSTYSNQ